MHNPLRLPCKMTSERPKVVRTLSFLHFFTLLTSTCASGHKGVHFFDVSTSKSGPNMWCFNVFTWKRASRHNSVHFFDVSTSKSVPNRRCFQLFLRQNVLRATTACNFSSLIWPAGSAPAALASLLFDPPEPQIIGKTQWIATFLPFRAPASSFFSLFLFSDLLTSFFSSLTLPTSAFSSFHIVGSLTSKFPSMRPLHYSMSKTRNDL